MPSIVLQAFSGETPRLIPRLMAPNAAQRAVNVRLDDGGLTPMLHSTIALDTANPLWRSIYLFGNDWLGWTGIVHAARGPVADVQKRLYYTGDGAPKVRSEAAVYPLAVPFPAAALAAVAAGTGTGTIVSRVYVHTYVTELGEESEPGPASAAVNWQSGQTVTLSGFAAAPPGRGIVKQRIYRSQTGTAGTRLYFIAERAASVLDYVDNIAPDAFLEPLPSKDWNAPPDALRGLISLPNGMMAAFDGKKLYFCEPYHPHAWPQKYVLTTDSPIVALGAIGTSVIIMTEGQPYLAQGTTPSTMQMVKIEQNYPCINERTVVDLGFAIAYASNEGLVIINSGGQISLATSNIFTREAWQSYSPTTMVSAQLNGRYVAFYQFTKEDASIERGTLLIDTSNQGFLVRMAAYSPAAFFDVTSSSLFFLDDVNGTIRVLDTDKRTRLEMNWKSKEFVEPQPVNFSAILIDAKFYDVSIAEAQALRDEAAAAIAYNAVLFATGALLGEINAHEINAYPLNGDVLRRIPALQDVRLKIKVYADGALVHEEDQVNQVARLPGGFTARRWEVEVNANIPIERIAMATSVDELRMLQ
jgi:hypothetical protein